MTTTPRSNRPRRSCHLGTKVEPRIYQQVEAFAVAEGYSLSSALNKILMDWDKRQQRVGKKGGKGT